MNGRKSSGFSLARSTIRTPLPWTFFAYDAKRELDEHLLQTIKKYYPQRSRCVAAKNGTQKARKKNPIETRCI